MPEKGCQISALNVIPDGTVLDETRLLLEIILFSKKIKIRYYCLKYNQGSKVNDRFEQANFNTKFLAGLLSIAIIGVSIYLTQHFYSVHFPVGLGGGGLCDISNFLNCDSATNSPFSNIAGAPISMLGIVIGLLFLFSISTAAIADSTVLIFGAFNMLGCIVLFIYSLVALGSLCPFCTVYYLLSAGVLFVFFKNTKDRKFSPPSFITVGGIFLLTILYGNLVYKHKVSEQSSLKDSLIKNYNELKRVDDLNLNLDFFISRSGTKLTDAPIQMTIFSDFQCPACKALSKMIHPVLRRYKDKINIDYSFYPLDPACNSKMTRNLHPLACKAAYFTYCTRDKFLETHDLIFDNQTELSSEWIEQQARKYGVFDCINEPETIKAVTAIVDKGSDVGIKSTPTFFLNNVKIEGTLPLVQLYMLMDEVLAKKND